MVTVNYKNSYLNADRGFNFAIARTACFAGCHHTNKYRSYFFEKWQS